MSKPVGDRDFLRNVVQLSKKKKNWLLGIMSNQLLKF